jgi:hypothetical protein
MERISPATVVESRNCFQPVSRIERALMSLSSHINPWQATGATETLQVVFGRIRSNKSGIVLEDGVLANHGKGLERLILTNMAELPSE